MNLYNESRVGVVAVAFLESIGKRYLSRLFQFFLLYLFHICFYYFTF